MNYNLILIGPTNSGKSSISFELNKAFGYYHISIGELLRERSMCNDEVACEIRNRLDEGSFVNNEIVHYILTEKLNSISFNHVILDGFPRNFSQIDILKKIYDINTIKNDFRVILLEIDEEEIVKRSRGRLYCFDCKCVYNLSFFIGKDLTNCNLCGSDKLIKRKDDEEKITRVKYLEFKKNIEEVISFFNDLNCLYRLDGKSKIEDNINIIKNIIRKK